MARAREASDEARWQKRMLSAGRVLDVVDRESGDFARGDVLLLSVKFLLQADAGTSVLAVVVGVSDEVEVVAFVGGPDLVTVVLAMGKRLEAGTLRWRENRPYSP